MLLKRTEKENIIECIYNSSNILSSKYDKQSKNLTIVFKRGAQYIYENVSQSDYLRFEIADSQGVVLNERIKQYPFIKGDLVDAKVIEEEIDKLKEEEIRKEQEILVNEIERLARDFDEHGSINMNMLISLHERIVRYLNPETNE